MKKLLSATRLGVEIECANDAQLSNYIEMGVHTGTARTLDNLAGYVSARAAEG